MDDEQIVILFIVTGHTMIGGFYCHPGLKLCCYYNRRLAQIPPPVPDSLASLLFFHQPPRVPRPPKLCGMQSWHRPLSSNSSQILYSSLSPLHLPDASCSQTLHPEIGAFGELKREI